MSYDRPFTSSFYLCLKTCHGAKKKDNFTHIFIFIQIKYIFICMVSQEQYGFFLILGQQGANTTPSNILNTTHY